MTERMRIIPASPSPAGTGTNERPADAHARESGARIDRIAPVRLVDGHQARLLVVDDEPTICSALRRLLALDGFEILTAQTGAHAEDILRTERVDGMVLDLRMPDQRGDVIYHIAMALQPHLMGRIIFFTGDISTRADAIIGDCHCEIVRKPEIDELTGHLRRMIPARKTQNATA